MLWVGWYVFVIDLRRTVEGVGEEHRGCSFWSVVDSLPLRSSNPAKAFWQSAQACFYFIFSIFLDIYFVIPPFFYLLFSPPSSLYVYKMVLDVFPLVFIGHFFIFFPFYLFLSLSLSLVSRVLFNFVRKEKEAILGEKKERERKKRRKESRQTRKPKSRLVTYLSVWVLIRSWSRVSWHEWKGEKENYYPVLIRFNYSFLFFLVPLSVYLSPSSSPFLSPLVAQR